MSLVSIFKNLFILDREKRKFSSDLRNLIGFIPKDLAIYKVAFQHSSMFPDVSENYERLEFLGDSLLTGAVSEYLFEQYPTKDEGYLTKFRSKIVSRNHLNRLAIDLGLEKHVVYDRRSLQDRTTSILGNSLEALIAAIYLDQGYEQVKMFISAKLIEDLVDMELLETQEQNYKSKLIEWAQKKNLEFDFKLLEEEILDRRSYFKMGACINGELKGTGLGYSKKEASQEAAKNALVNLE